MTLKMGKWKQLWNEVKWHAIDDEQLMNKMDRDGNEQNGMRQNKREMNETINGFIFIFVYVYFFNGTKLFWNSALYSTHKLLYLVVQRSNY